VSDGLISPHWHRVAQLKPGLHSHVEIHRHDYRGLIWYLLEDTTSGRNHRFNPAAYQFIGLIDGKNRVQDIFDQVSELLGEYAPGQDEVIQLLGQLHTADLLQSNAVIDTDELFDRQVQQKKNQIKQRFSNPVTQKVALWDPEEFLNKHFSKVEWIFSFWVALIWFLIVVYALLQMASNWPQISQHFSINTLSPYNLLIVFLLYPPIKFLHELGHAFSAKLEGGEVHEMGVNFMMFIPIPYVNVSTSTHFRSKYKRMLVSAAGILVETFLASLGLLLFLATEPGLLQDIGFNIFIIGGISSLFFNGNPLLKYDGYYILSDALGIPNLFQRASHYWRYLFQRYLLGMREAQSPVNAPGEGFWFISYGFLSALYRLAILWFVIAIVAQKFFALGVLLAIWLLGQQVFLPLFKALKFIVYSPYLRKNRVRAIGSCSSLIALFISVTMFLPVPSHTLAEGIIWHPEEAQIKAEQDGFAGQLLVQNNQIINAGTAILQLSDPFLDTQSKIARARVKELQSKYRAKRLTNIVEARMIKDASQVASLELNFVLEKMKSMSVTAPKTGKILLPEADDLPGRFIHQGDLLGYILDDEPPTIRLAVSQDNIGQLDHSVLDINVRLANDLSKNYKARVIRQAPEASNQLPSAALTTKGGGQFIVAPGQKDDRITLDKVFLIDLGFESKPRDVPLGTRAYIRFSHASEPMAKQWYRRIRQAFLRQFDV
jgi:putative peptide zinc metalloprotease protein